MRGRSIAYIDGETPFAILPEMLLPDRIYLDHAATTPMHPAARAAMIEALDRAGNPSSPHREGRAARAALEEARRRVAAALGWDGAVIFTSGASEALALAIDRSVIPGRAASAVEHDAVRRAAPGATIVPVSHRGRIEHHALPEEALIVAQLVNNETGVIQDEREIGEAARNRASLWLADCAQSAGKIPLPAAHMIAVSAHKLGGPPGVGALLLRDLAMLRPVGGQEMGYRQGTENLPAILGFAAALESDRGWLEGAPALRDRLEQGIRAAGGRIVCASQPRIATIGAYRMPGVPAASQVIQLDMAGIAVSAGSACSSGSVKPSHVLTAMDWPEGEAREVIRVSFGRDTGEEEVDRFLAAWTRLAEDARRRAA